MHCVALVEYEDRVLCPAEQQPRTCLPTYLELVAQALQHMARRALTTTYLNGLYQAYTRDIPGALF